MSEEIVPVNGEPVEVSTSEGAGAAADRRSFLRRLAAGSAAVVLVPFLSLHDRFGRNLSKAEAAEIAGRIASGNPGVLTICSNHYCGTYHCSNNYDCGWFFSPSCTDYCKGGHCEQVYCSSNYHCADYGGCYPSFVGCSQDYCNPEYCGTEHWGC